MEIKNIDNWIYVSDEKGNMKYCIGHYVQNEFIKSMDKASNFLTRQEIVSLLKEDECKEYYQYLNEDIEIPNYSILPKQAKVFIKEMIKVLTWSEAKRIIKNAVTAFLIRKTPQFFLFLSSSAAGNGTTVSKTFYVPEYDKLLAAHYMCGWEIVAGSGVKTIHTFSSFWRRTITDDLVINRTKL